MNTRPVDDDALGRWPLPTADDDGDKNERGRVLIVAGCREMPGAAVLAATAALRAGAGKLQIATAASVASLVAIAVPESRVISLPEDSNGNLDGNAAGATLKPFVEHADAVLIGPGMDEGDAVIALVNALLPHMAHASLVLDASAMQGLCNSEKRFDSPVILTPHAGEMAKLAGIDKKAVDADPASTAMAAACRWNALVALKGPTTFIASPDGTVWQHDAGNVGLATSGSGDTLAGIIAGLAARGASLDQAGVWGVALHAKAGDQLARRVGSIGFLAREIPACIPGLMQEATARYKDQPRDNPPYVANDVGT